MAVNFQELMRKPAGKAQKPQALPVAQYPGIVQRFALDVSAKKQTPFVRFFIQLTEWPEEVQEEDRKMPDGTPVLLAKREQNISYYFTDSVLWRLDALLKNFGIDTEGRTYEEAIPEMVGKTVLVDLQQRMIEGTSDTANEVKDIAPN